MKTKLNKGFTLIELLVVITIIAILASIAVPVYNGITIRAEQSKALSNAKQIALGCKIFAIDEDGLFPDVANGIPAAATISYVGGDAMTASADFAALIDGKYIPSETIFWISKEYDGMTRLAGNKPDDDLTDGTDFGQASTAWGYTAGADDNANPSLPLVYTRSSMAAIWPYDNTSAEGGIWRDKIIVVSIDYSGKTVKLTQTGMTGAAILDSGANLFTDAAYWPAGNSFTQYNN